MWCWLESAVEIIVNLGRDRNFGVALICAEQAARRRIPEDNLHSHRRIGVKSDMVEKDRND